MPPSSFSKEQLSEIRKASLARIVCNNGDRTDFVQPLAMVSSDVYLNAFQYCNTQIIPQIDLGKWKTSPTSAAHNLTISRQLVSSEIARARREALQFFEFENSVHGELSDSQLMHYKTARAKRHSIAIANQSFILEKATRGILQHLRQGRDREADNKIEDDIHHFILELPKVQLEDYFLNQFFTQNILPGDECDDNNLPCDYTSPFRTITGLCNNLAHPDFGKSQSLFERFLPPSYEDGISVPRRFSVKNGKFLPSPRLISVSVHNDISAPHVRYVSITHSSV